MKETRVEKVINIIKNMDTKDKLRLGICLTTSDWTNLLYNKTEMWKWKKVNEIGLFCI